MNIAQIGFFEVSSEDQDNLKVISEGRAQLEK